MISSKPRLPPGAISLVRQPTGLQYLPPRRVSTILRIFPLPVLGYIHNKHVETDDLRELRVARILQIIFKMPILLFFPQRKVLVNSRRSWVWQSRAQNLSDGKSRDEYLKKSMVMGVNK